MPSIATDMPSIATLLMMTRATCCAPGERACCLTVSQVSLLAGLSVLLLPLGPDMADSTGFPVKPGICSVSQGTWDSSLPLFLLAFDLPLDEFLGEFGD